VADGRKSRTPVTTRRGDGGYTSLWGGEEVAKYDPRPEAYGTLDEATAVLGQARTASRHHAVQHELMTLQNDLFRMMSVLAAGSAKSDEVAFGEAQVEDIEARIVRIRDDLQLPEMFVVAATPNAATLDVARTVIRRAERLVARMLHDGLIDNRDTLRFLNRASDLAFVLARLEERSDGVPYQTISAANLD
jgi:cob(I)alamin adenosyltransferase